MSGMSDRDQKLILVLLTAMIIFLPYFFFIKDKRIETESIKTENVTLQERLEYLRGLDAERDRYLRETDEMNASRDAIIASFPADIKQENYTMFLLETEYSNVTEDPETGLYFFDEPIVFKTVTYGDNIETPISSEEADTGFTGYTNTSTIDYNCYYGGFKYLLEYFMNYKDPMTYRNITASFNVDTGLISGSIELDQYAISGDDRTLPAVIIKPNLDDTHMRGNEEVGIFGPVNSTEDEEAEEPAAEVEETEEAEETE